MEPDVAPDGSPVVVYRALPAQPEFTPVLDIIDCPASVLDLGCGVGRLANVLAARGCEVTGVDESPEMLAHLHPAVRGVQSSLVGLDLGSRFAVVVLASRLVNVADDEQRAALLRAAADHVAATGTVLVQHWELPPAVPTDSDGEVGDVRIAFRVLARDARCFEGRVTYTLGDRSWEQTFRAAVLDDQALDAELAGVGLERVGRLSPTWLAARPTRQVR